MRLDWNGNHLQAKKRTDFSSFTRTTCRNLPVTTLNLHHYRLKIWNQFLTNLYGILLRHLERRTILYKNLQDSNLKADTPSSVDQSPAALGKGRGKGQRKRKPKPGPVNVAPLGLAHNPMGQTQPGMGIGVQAGNPQMGHPMGGYGQNPGHLVFFLVWIL